VKGQGRGFGIVILVVVVAIVLLLTTRAWKAVMPAAAQAVKPGSSTTLPDHGQKQAGEAVRSGGLPDLKQMGKSTDAHRQAVQDASKSQD
jgi:hypothetical protein